MQGVANETKPRVMLIPDSICWILGTWAREIAKWNSGKYEFIIFPWGEIEENRNLFLSVLREIDIVHCLSPWRFSRVKALVENNDKSSRPLISTVHHIVKLIDVESCLDVDRIMVVCRKYLETLIQGGVPKHKLFLVHNGVDVDFFSAKDKTQSRKKLEVPLDAFTVGFSAKATSNHDGRKGIDLFLKILANLPPNLSANTHVMLTGPGWEEIIKCYSLSKIHLHYFPFLPKETMPYFYSALDVYLITSRVEGGPAPLLEAMSCRTPIITTPVGMVPEFVKNGVNGLIVPIGDIKNAVKAIEKVCTDKNFAEKIGSAGKETIFQKLQWKKTLSEIHYLYNFRDVRGNLSHRGGNNIYSVSKLNSLLIERDIKRWQKIIRGQPKGYYLHNKFLNLLNNIIRGYL